MTTRVQNYYFARMMALGIIDKTIYAEMPPRVEYYLTDYGLRIFEILKYIKAVQKDIEAELELENAEGLGTFLTVRD
ncbi:transcriptional regulator [Methylovulum psychrotolerans]|uniref:Transcriptional regulator n=1 Tax=Methylovulum psychrotolerans TaxID=1704499 RepID=A0A2S5CNX0_9GAMM|nr:transcriptional regulator [Methylovulum psychrotolerans]